MHALAILLSAAATLTPLQKAELMVVTTEHQRVFSGAAHIRFADQEGGLVKAFPDEPRGRLRATSARPPRRSRRDERRASRYAGTASMWTSGRFSTRSTARSARGS